ncbi:MAG TPA: glutathione S-transferase family protein [Alphaproteobacteria bacterium]|nr:glutathione S-transferase family protein [Alphaproteobacteria bacterium]
MKLYSGPLSLFSRKVEIALAEKGISFDRVMVPFSQAEGYFPKHPDVLSANPKGQVPVLEDGDLTLFDSTVINEYLDEAYPDPPLLPTAPEPRARCRLLELAADEILLPMIARLMYRTEPADPDPARQREREADGERAESVIEAYYGTMEGHLADKEYLEGMFSVADISLFMDVLFAERLGGPPLDRHAGLTAWYARLCGRPSIAPIVAEIAEADRILSR